MFWARFSYQNGKDIMLILQEQEVEQRLVACYHVLIMGRNGREGGVSQGKEAVGMEEENNKDRKVIQ